MPATYAYFYVLGFDCDPTAITKHLLLEPTKVWRRGDPHPRRKNHFFDYSGWELDSGLARDGYDLDALVRALVDRLHPLADRLASLPPHKSKGINCVGYYFSENPGFHLTADLAGKIGRLGLEVDFDLYNMRDSNELYFMRIPEEPNQVPVPMSGLRPAMAHRNRSAEEMSDEPLTLYFIPSLVATLWHDEKKKGSPLTEDEVLAIRDKCPVVALREETVRLMDEKRGYKDINADDCWASWLEAREGLIAYERDSEKTPIQPPQTTTGSSAPDRV